jgi:hypothetical protein
MIIQNLSINDWNTSVYNSVFNYAYNRNANNSNSFLQSLKFNYKKGRFNNFNEEILIELTNLKVFKYLKKLDVSNTIPFITDMNSIAIVNNCTKLEIIDLFNCSRITRKSLIEIGKKCLNLEFIDRRL